MVEQVVYPELFSQNKLLSLSHERQETLEMYSFCSQRVNVEKSDLIFSFLSHKKFLLEDYINTGLLSHNSLGTESV